MADEVKDNAFLLSYFVLLGVVLLGKLKRTLLVYRDQSSLKREKNILATSIALPTWYN